MEITPGLRLGPYKVLKHLGSGAMGAVYLAYDERLERQVALKLLTHRPGDDTSRRVLREARAVARLHHTNVAGLYDMFEHDHEAFLVMEYVDGEPLTSLVTSPPAPIDRVLDIGLQLTDALRYAHREGIIHRDVKPANVMLTRDGVVKVLDLGLARAAADPGADTRSGSEVAPTRAGTPAYMAPERLGGHPADARTDVYSVGVVLYELLTGKRPYVAPDLMTLAVNVATHPTPRVSAIRRDVPAALDALVARAMSKDPETRFASAAELHDELERLRGGTPRKPVRSRRRLVPIGVAAVLVGALAWWLAVRGGAPQRFIPVAPSTVAIPPVVTAIADQADLDELGSLLQSVLSRNLAVLPGITIVPAAGPSTEPPGYTVSLTIRRAVSGLGADADIRRSGEARPARQPFTGADELALADSVLDGLATGLRPTQDRQALISYLRGRTLLDLSDDRATDAQAVEAFQEAIKRDASFAFAHAGLSQAYASTAKHTNETRWLDLARDAAAKAAEIDLKCDQAHIAFALLFRALTRTRDAIANAREAVMLTPDNDDARRILGLALLDDKQLEAGISELKSAVRLKPRRTVNLYYLGWGLLKARRYEEAIEPLKEATELRRNFESAWTNLGFAYLKVGDWEKSSGSSSRALELDKTDSVALTNLANAYYWDGKYDQAVGRFREAVRNDPESVLRRMNLGDALDAVGQRQQAKDEYAKCVELAGAQLPKFDAPTAGMAAKCQAKLGNKAEAEQLAAQAWQAADQDADVVYKFAVVYALNGQPEKALDKLDVAIKLGKPRWEVQADPDLKSLRSHPRFKAMAAKPSR
ncbi:MAG TPA: serine/threonine-protein kinase [Vicinamibacterales bacterium]|nr:serine/threonine-protein kinase [Vicinamibacterales bacterium]